MPRDLHTEKMHNTPIMRRFPDSRWSLGMTKIAKLNDIARQMGAFSLFRFSYQHGSEHGFAELLYKPDALDQKGIVDGVAAAV